MSRDVFVVIPTFNEDCVLRSTVSGVVARGYSAVVVDDGSSTPAQDCLNGLNVYCLRHVVNLGQGAALRTGSDFALSKGARIVVHFDADGQHFEWFECEVYHTICDGHAAQVVFNPRAQLSRPHACVWK